MSNVPVPAVSAPITLSIADPAALSTLTEALAGEQFSVYNLPKIAVPRESVRFTIETDEGERDVTEITGVILDAKIAKSYWSQAYGSGQTGAPDCRSNDGKSGIGTPGGNCLICPFNQYGTAVGGEGKACKENRILFFLVDGDMIPSIITLPPTSIKPWMNYQMALMKRANPCYGVRTALTLEKTSNKSGKRYITVNFRVDGKLGAEDFSAIQAYRQAMAPMIQSYNATVDTGDVIEAAPAPAVDNDIVRDAANSPFGGF